MSHVFKNQSLLRITAETGYNDLASTDVHRILYTKPDGSSGFFEGTISGTKLIYNLVAGDIDQEGYWNFQAYVEIGGLKGYGEIAKHYFSMPLG